MCAPCKIILNSGAASVAEGHSLQKGVKEAVELILSRPKKYDPRGRFTPEIQNRLSALDALWLDGQMSAAPEMNHYEYWQHLRGILKRMAGVESFSRILEG